LIPVVVSSFSSEERDILAHHILAAFFAIPRKGKNMMGKNI
jgi:hypothetical protein